MMSAVAIAGRHGKVPTFVAVGVSLLAFGLPVLETTLSIVRRMLSGVPVFRPDREHIHHKLLDLGFTQRQVAMLLYLFCAACALASLFILSPDRAAAGLVLLVLAICVGTGVRRLGYVEFFELRRATGRALTAGRALSANIALQKTVQRLAACRTTDELEPVLVELTRLLGFDAYELLVEGHGRFSPYCATWHRNDASPQYSFSICLYLTEIAPQIGRLELSCSSGRAAETNLAVLFDEARIALAAALGNLFAEPVGKAAAASVSAEARSVVIKTIGIGSKNKEL
jgi:hypothetical protein